MVVGNSTLAYQVVDAVKSVTGSGSTTLHEPCFDGNEWAYLKECLDSTFVSSAGKFVDQFESNLASYTGAKHAVAVVNGTAALHMSLMLSGVKPDDEVLVPALTFIATANAVNYCGAIPHFVDSEELTLGLDPQALREYLQIISEVRNGQCVNRNTGRVIRALIPMHTFGHPVDLDGILAVARDFHLVMVEDAAESLGSTYHGRHTGTFGRMSALSFNGNKIITTGGGGAILTNDPTLAKRAKHITTTSKLPHRWNAVHDGVGYNYRLPNINAALGCAQLEKLDKFIVAKRKLFERYKVAFSNIPNVSLVPEATGCKSNYWLQNLLLDNSCANERDSILNATHDEGLMTRPTWTLIHKQAPYAQCPKMELGVAESLECRLISLPSSARLGMEG